MLEIFSYRSFSESRYARKKSFEIGFFRVWEKLFGGGVKVRVFEKAVLVDQILKL